MKIDLLGNPIFGILSRLSKELRLEAYVVGGYVRDTLMGRACDDIDITVISPPGSMQRGGIILAQALKDYIGGDAEVVVYERFGCAAVIIASGCRIEFVGARRESYDRTSRKPIVEDGTLQDDLLRRDFTINALAASLDHNTFGEVIDMFGGLNDLKTGRITTPTDPAVTFSDDPLRMFRCIRFAARYSFTIDPAVFESIRSNVGRLEIVSAERIATELNKIMACQDPVTGFTYLKQSGLLQYILPELSALDVDGSGEKEGGRHKNNLTHSLRVLENVAQRSDKLWLRWAALLHDIGKDKTKRFDPVEGWTFHSHEFVGAEMCDEIFRRLRLSMKENALGYVKKLIALHMRPSMIVTEDITDSAVRRLLNDAGDDIDDLLLLCECDVTSGRAETLQRVSSHYQELRRMIRDFKERDYKRLFQPCLNGEDIMRLFNLPPCHVIGVLKEAAKEAILEGTCDNTPESVTALLMNKYEELKHEGLIS